MAKKILISPSILEYEPFLCVPHALEFGKISRMIEAGIDYLHIDIMRKPFIPDKDAFHNNVIEALYERFKDDVNFDFHLMVSLPHSFVKVFEGLIRDENKRKNTIITVHTESYRNEKTLGEYAKKQYDLLYSIETLRNEDQKTLIRETDELSKRNLTILLKNLKCSGFKTGIALEPGTGLDNLRPNLMVLVDMVLLMGVESGAGGQKYHKHVTDKITTLRSQYPDLMIQVDGGVNDETIPEIVKARANNLVIGSYITNQEKIYETVKDVREQIEKY